MIKRNIFSFSLIASCHFHTSPNHLVLRFSVLWQCSSSRSSWRNKVINYYTTSFAAQFLSNRCRIFHTSSKLTKETFFPSIPFSAETTESELCRVFSAYGNVKSTKIIVDRAGVSKGYGFVTFDTPAVIDSLMVRKPSFLLVKFIGFYYEMCF